MNVHRFYAPFLEYFRSRRARWIQQEFRTCESVLDLGGSAPTWDRLSFPDRITLLNLEDHAVYPSSASRNTCKAAPYRCGSRSDF